MSEPSAWVICDHCDAREAVGSSAVNQARIAMLEQQGWKITQGPNYCPRCAKQLRYEGKRT